MEKLCQEKDPRHPLYGYTAPRARLKSRHSFIKATTALDSDPSRARERLWQTNHPPPSDFVPPKECLPAGYNLQWPTWKSLNRLRSQVGRCKEHLVKWGYALKDESTCDCGVNPQTMAHLLSCPKCPFTCSYDDLIRATDTAVNVTKYWQNMI